MARSPVLSFALSSALLACEGTPGADASASVGTGESTSEGATTAAQEPVPLVAITAWQEVDAAVDPLADHRPEPAHCPFGSVFVEGEELEIDTNFCTYAMIGWPALVDVDAGSELTLTLRHYDLTAAAPAIAHIALVVDDAVVWERELAIPGPAEVIVETIPIATSFAAGAPIYFHLHNHGQNTYILSSIATRPP